MIDAPSALRVALLVVAAAVLVWAADRLQGERGCQDARADAFLLRAGVSAERADRVLARVLRSCPDGDAAVAAAGALLDARRAPQALRAATAAVEREPEDHRAWLALGRAREATGDAAGATRALGRAHGLDPLGVPPR